MGEADIPPLFIITMVGVIVLTVSIIMATVSIIMATVTRITVMVSAIMVTRSITAAGLTTKMDYPQMCFTIGKKLLQSSKDTFKNY